MTSHKSTMPLLARFSIVLSALTCLALFTLWGHSQTPEELPAPRPQASESPAPRPQLTFTISTAVQWALEHNPLLATFRRNRGIAQAGVVIARQYPFNPIVQDFVWGANGPASAGITNRVFNEHTARLDLELFHQGRYRRGLARAALTRTEWEIAAQELLVSIQVVRAFNTALYRQNKYRILEETAQFQEQTAEFIAKLAEQNKAVASDALLARADVAEARTLMGPGRGVHVVAQNDLRRALGLTNENYEVEGTLERGFVAPPAGELVQAAMARRPDLKAFEFAVQEADNRLRFEVANRWGNPSLGPAYEFNETSVNFVGMWLIWSPPIINQRRGEIQLREAEKARAVQVVRQSEVQIQQDVYIAMARLEQAERVVNVFATQTLPELRKLRARVDKLFEDGAAGVDLARVIDVRRRVLRARDAYLDALWELSQAHADLAAAVSDLSFVGASASPVADAMRCAAPTVKQ